MSPARCTFTKCDSFQQQSLCRGFSLLEVLVALVVLSLGLLGIAGLQLTSVRYGYSANLLYQAALQANDMADRMRANMVGVNAGAYNNISGVGADPGCISVSCSPAQMAATDAYQWNTLNATQLPSGAGTVTGAGANSVFTITLTWNEPGPGNMGIIARTFSTSFQP